MWWLFGEGCEAHSTGLFVETGVTATKYVPQLLVTFDISPDNVNLKDDCNERYLALLQSV